jgi:hypothetical protein
MILRRNHNFKTILLILFCIFFSCTSKSKYKSVRRIEWEAKKYTRKFGYSLNFKDTTIFHKNNLKLVYNKGYLVSIGEVKDGRKSGKWFYFHEHNGGSYIYALMFFIKTIVEEVY